MVDDLSAEGHVARAVARANAFMKGSEARAEYYGRLARQVKSSESGVPDKAQAFVDWALRERQEAIDEAHKWAGVIQGFDGQ